MNRFVPHDFTFKIGIATVIHKHLAVTSFKNWKHLIYLGLKLSIAATIFDTTFVFAFPEKKEADSALCCLRQRKEMLVLRKVV